MSNSIFFSVFLLFCSCTTASIFLNAFQDNSCSSLGLFIIYEFSDIACLPAYNSSVLIFPEMQVFNYYDGNNAVSCNGTFQQSPLDTCISVPGTVSITVTNTLPKGQFYAGKFFDNFDRVGFCAGTSPFTSYIPLNACAFQMINTIVSANTAVQSCYYQDTSCKTLNSCDPPQSFGCDDGILTFVTTF